MSAEQLNGMLSAVASMPNLERGRCVGQWDLWEAIDDPVAVQQAIQGCLECPFLQRCADWGDSLPPSKRPHGVVAAAMNGAKS